MTDPGAWQDFRGQIDAALDLLRDRDAAMPGGKRGEMPGELAAASALPSLLEQCRDMAGAPDATPVRPVMRSIHHFACSGGTLISRCIAAMPNTWLLSEVDPLSPMMRKQLFVPTDLNGLARIGSRPPRQETLVEIFRAGLAALAAEARRTGTDLILRDHAHSHFCFGPDIPGRPSLREMLATGYTCRALVTVRHPLDAYLGLLHRDWLRIEPATLEEYARRHGVFLDHYADAPVLRYEDFVADPEAGMQRACTVLGLAYNPDFREMFPVITLSGDSGRKGDEIEPRPRRPVPAAVATEAARSPAYAALCARLNYDPAPG